ncbi:RasGEF domain-containing protein, partial [uncultured Legionella sp.]|uniref:pentapeptide repeat-containing protein n=1 Tax=uncultured Legionella sp. TaxID=210934 RepID=UPI00260706FF
SVLVLCLNKSAKKKSSENSVLSLFVTDMLERLNKTPKSLDPKNITEFNRFLYLSYIKSFFMPVAYELAASYDEQLVLLQSSKLGVIRFAHYIADCSSIILRKTDGIETLFSQKEYPLDKTPLKSFFVLAAITQSGKIKTNKQLELISGQDISISKFMSAMGVRHQVKCENTSKAISYQYYIPAKKKSSDITYGNRNSIFNEVIGKAFSLVKADETPQQRSSIMFATSDDVKEYLTSLGDDGFLGYMSIAYFGGNKAITIYCTQLDFQDLDMSMANFDGVIFNRCNFNNADLTKASFNGCAIFDSQFKGTVLNATQFYKSKLSFSDLSQTKFGADNLFSNSIMQFVNLEGLALNNANFNCVDLTGANHLETDFSGASTTSLSSNGSISVSTYLSEQQSPQELIPIANLPFQPYLISLTKKEQNIASLMTVLFSNESISGHSINNLIEIDSSILSMLAYGVHATGDNKHILSASGLYTGEKTNRKNAASFFWDTLSNIEKTDIIPQLSGIDKPFNVEHEKFIAGISAKNIEQIDEYASVLAQEIFSYDRFHFTSLKFYELMQEALNTKEKKPAPNFTALQAFSDRLYYRVNDDVSNANEQSCIKVFQLYMHTATKLCKIPCLDLQGAFWIIQGLSRNILKHVDLSEDDNKLLKGLLQCISPFGNFYNLRQLISQEGIPFLPIITRDILMSMSENGTKSYLEQMLSLGSIQQALLHQQTYINKNEEFSVQMHLTSDFISTTNKISSGKIQSFIDNGDAEQATSSNEAVECISRKSNPGIDNGDTDLAASNGAKIEGISRTSNSRYKRRLSIKELPRFFGRKEEASKEEPSNELQVKNDDAGTDPNKLSDGATL